MVISSALAVSLEPRLGFGRVKLACYDAAVAVTNKADIV